MSKRILAAACAAATALALSACSSTPSSEGNATKDGTLTVMASFYPLQYLAEKIGGEHVTVTSLTPAGAEPHDLELSPKTVDALASADAVVYLAGFQSAVDEAIEQQAPKTVIDVSPAAELVEANSSANHPSEDEDADDLFVIGERDTIDIDTQLRDAIVTLVDPRPLCSSDCAGLCDVCGEKWVDLPADHEHVVIDPRLASLASLLGESAEPGRS